MHRYNSRASIITLGTATAILTVGVVWATQLGTNIDDFFNPGSQPAVVGPSFDEILPSVYCQSCHVPGTDDVPVFNRWEGSAMANAARDPLFWAGMAIANQDVQDVGDLCIRCHAPKGWLEGRSTPTDGSALTLDDRDGITCNFCHRMVDPVFKPGISPAVDEAILADLSSNGLLPVNLFNGSYIVDPVDRRRGPFDIIAALGFDPHSSGGPTQISPYHKSSDLCGNCHDVSNPAFTRTEDDQYVVNTLGQEHPTLDKYDMFPVERTYSEWLMSSFADGPIDMTGRFGGDDPLVSTCQDCHMPTASKQGCSFGPVRADMPQHDFSGGSTWMLDAVLNLNPSDNIDPKAIAASKARSISMLQRAATVELSQVGCYLEVRVINQTGHKLPTGYPEGRRMWLNVQFTDVLGDPVAERGFYDGLTADLTTADTKVYEAHLGIDDAVAAATGVPAGVSFHFALNNLVIKDNRIPPRGFTNAEFADIQASPIGIDYADGEYWDDTRFFVPPGSTDATVTLYYQSSSKEYIEFLLNENVTNTDGQILYDQWVLTGMSAPIDMATQVIALAPHAGGDYDGSGGVDLLDYAEFPGCEDGPDVLVGVLCEPFDCDDDGDVDLYDFAGMGLSLSAGL